MRKPAWFCGPGVPGVPRMSGWCCPRCRPRKLTRAALESGLNGAPQRRASARLQAQPPHDGLGKGREMRRLLLLLVVVVVAAAAAGGGYALASKDAQAHGSLRSQPLVEGCTSPIGFCTVGRASGTIKGDFVFTAFRS